ncbi:hypothetical protein [Plantactinospora soyae]|uniref:Uncharacterized protein n=1 Tax=Plantactinospora soyae TaxID=1544732 RepID=A0A927R0S9_9ACTN|nr:hypothetical protein [Plantactinospora soyae]MBE1491925.1 hypothetical protein [Plantactinospora soyae]
MSGTALPVTHRIARGVTLLLVLVSFGVLAVGSGALAWLLGEGAEILERIGSGPQ